MNNLSKKEIKIVAGIFLLVVILALIVNLVYDKKRPNKVQTEKLSASLSEVEELKKQIKRQESIIKNQEESIKEYQSGSGSQPTVGQYQEQAGQGAPESPGTTTEENPEIVTPEEDSNNKECANKISEKESKIEEQENQLKESKDKLKEYENDKYIEDCKEGKKSKSECKDEQKNKVKEQEDLIKEQEDTLEKLKEELDKDKEECGKDN